MRFFHAAFLCNLFYGETKELLRFPISIRLTISRHKIKKALRKQIYCHRWKFSKKPSNRKILNFVKIEDWKKKNVEHETHHEERKLNCGLWRKVLKIYDGIWVSQKSHLRILRHVIKDHILRMHKRKFHEFCRKTSLRVLKDSSQVFPGKNEKCDSVKWTGSLQLFIPTKKFLSRL